jgi:hypothetical protein
VLESSDFLTDEPDFKKEWELSASGWFYRLHKRRASGSPGPVRCKRVADVLRGVIYTSPALAAFAEMVPVLVNESFQVLSTFAPWEATIMAHYHLSVRNELLELAGDTMRCSGSYADALKSLQRLMGKLRETITPRQLNPRAYADLVVPFEEALINSIRNLSTVVRGINR